MDSNDREFFRDLWDDPDLERMAAERERIMREIDALSQRLEAATGNERGYQTESRIVQKTP